MISQVPTARRSTLAGCRVLLLREHPCCGTDAGAQVEETSTLLPDLEATHATYVAMLEAITTRGDPSAGPPISAHAWIALEDEQARIRRRWRALFEAQFDIVLMPPFGTTAFEHFAEPDVDRRLLAIDGRPRPHGEQLAWPAVATLPGLPATVAPIARDAAGWPIGVQVMGPYLGDRTTIALAGRIAEL